MDGALFTGVVIASLAGSAVATALLLRMSRFLAMDVPNDRSLHNRPVPRAGGLGILAGLATGLVLLAIFSGASGIWFWIAAGAGITAGISLLDDAIDVPPLWRLFVHLIAASVVTAAGLSLRAIALPGFDIPLPFMVGALVSVLFLGWMTNLYNFMDGIDGLAAGMAVIGFGVYAVLGWLAGETVFAAIGAVIACSAAGFLVFNFPPARIFMGDVGSSVLGFLAGALTLWADQARVFPLWIGVLVFSPFIADASLTLTRRLLRGDKIWEAHKTHYYQRLVQLGWGHRKTTVRGYGVMLLCALSAVIAARVPPLWQWVIVGLWIAGYALLIARINRWERRIAVTRQ